MTRKTLHDMEMELDTLRGLIGIAADGRGRTFQNKKSGDYYIALDTGYREQDMATGVWYAPLNSPRVKFFRTFGEFQRKFEPAHQNRK